MRRTAGIILGFCLVVANLWAAQKSDPCAALKKARDTAEKAEADAVKDLQKTRQDLDIATKEEHINRQEADQAFDKWAACLETKPSCTAEEQAMTKARSRANKADNEFLELSKKEQTAIRAYEDAIRAYNQAIGPYGTCVQKNAKPKPKTGGGPRVERGPLPKGTKPGGTDTPS
jgi:hypothetical protein